MNIRFTGTELPFLIICTIVSICESVARLSVEECFELGLNKANLLCSSCDSLQEFELSDILEYVRGADPIIKLMNEEGEVMETLAIDKWNTDSVEEFLATYLDLPDKLENEI